jgi:hypothetical protein
MNPQLQKRLEYLEQQIRIFRLIYALSLVGLVVYACRKLFRSDRQVSRHQRQESDSREILRVRGLIVVDENGTERVWIGAPLPDPLLLGKRYQRQGAISGILLMDADGNERSGYVTGDEGGGVFLTLDNMSGQAATFLANASTGVNLQMWDENRNRIELMVFDEIPLMSLMRRGETVFQSPENKGGSD